MRLLSTLALAASVSFLPVQIGAQQNVGINLFRGSVTLSGVLCGFDCNSPTNTGQATAQANDTIGIRLLGQANFPGAVMLGAGATVRCPGLHLPGIGNRLLVDPLSGVVLAVNGAILGNSRGSCGETANQVMFTITLPRLPIGTLVHFQGLVYDAGQPAFTRPIDLTIS
jgi:hypothetical protein